MRKRIYDALDDVIDKVLSKQQKVLYGLARDFPDLSHEELAKRAGTTAKTVGAQLSNAYKAVEEFRKTGLVRRIRAKKGEKTIQAKKEGQAANTSQEVISEIAEACEYFAEGFRSASKALRILSKKPFPGSEQFIQGISSLISPVDGFSVRRKRESREKPAEDG